MVFSLSKLASALKPGPMLEKEQGSQRLLLYALSFVAAGVSMISVAWASDDFAFACVQLAITALGYLVSFSGRLRWFRLSLVIYPAVFLAIWLMRQDLLTIFVGGSLAPIARLITILQVSVSFNLRSIRTLYDSLLLSLLAVLLASEGALSLHYALFLLVFTLIAMFFMTIAHTSNVTPNLQWAKSPGIARLAMPALLSVPLVFGTAFVLFILLPQNHNVGDAGPLPSRLDLTVGNAVPFQEMPAGEALSSSQFLPSRSRPESVVAAPSGLRQQDTGQKIRTDAAGTPRPSNIGYATLGYLGDRENQVVMYVRSPLSSYWRGQVLDEYDGKGWLLSEGSSQIVSEEDGTIRFSDTPPWTGNTRSYIQTYFLRVPQPNAIFTGYSPGIIPMDATSEMRDLQGGFKGNIQSLSQRRNYKVISALSNLTPELLESDSADRDYLRRLQPLYIPQRVRELAKSIVVGAQSDYEKAALLEQFLLRNFDYDLRVPALRRSGDVVETFLFERKAGYCAQFATTMAVMARAVDLPARIATGYMPGTYDSLTGLHTVRLQDAHAWVEIKFKKFGWVPFDPTPRPDSAWALDRGFTLAAINLQEMLRGQVKDLWFNVQSSAVKNVTATFGGLSPSYLAGATSFLIGSFITLCLVLMARRSKHKHAGLPQAYTPLPGRDRIEVKRMYWRALHLLRRRAYPQRQAYQSPGDYVRYLQHLQLPVPQALHELSRIATDAFYCPQPLNHSRPYEAKEQLKHLEQSIKSIR